MRTIRLSTAKITDERWGTCLNLLRQPQRSSSKSNPEKPDEANNGQRNRPIKILQVFISQVTHPVGMGC